MVAPRDRAAWVGESPLPWSEETARPIVADACKRHLHLLAKFPYVGLDDVVQRCLVASWKSHPNYDPAKGAYTTWLNTLCWRNIIDLARECTRRSRRDVLGVRPDSAEDPVADLDRSRGLDVAEWLEGAYYTIRRNTQAYGRLAPFAAEAAEPAKRKRGRQPVFSVAQILALHALRKRMNLSLRGTIVLLEQNPRLVQILQLPRLPNHGHLYRRSESVAQFGSGKAIRV